MRDYQTSPDSSKRQHFEEWVRLVEKIEDPSQFEQRVSELWEMDFSIHYHVWTQIEILELMLYLRTRLDMHFEIELFLKNGYEVVMVLRKES